MMHWEKKIPNSKGLWANSSDGKTLRSVYIFREDSCWNSDCYWCRIGDIPEISPQMKKLSLENLIECVKNQKEIMISDAKDIFYFKEPLKISSLRIFQDGSYLVYVKDNDEKFSNSFNSFYGDV